MDWLPTLQFGRKLAQVQEAHEHARARNQTNAAELHEKKIIQQL